MSDIMRGMSDETADALSVCTFLTGSAADVMAANERRIAGAFDEERIAFLDTVSKNIRADSRSRAYPDAVTFAFWIRKANMELLAKRFPAEEGYYTRGRGVVFHIAPSNVAVNFAYSLATGFITGNTNIVRLPSKDFIQVSIIVSAINEALEHFNGLKGSIILVKYGHEQEINDLFSDICSVRVIWGGDNTINEVRTSPIRPRTTEVTFADRYSYAIIDAADYLSASEEDSGKRIAHDFYNDTYLTDQNACSSPRTVIWVGDTSNVAKAKLKFWKALYEEVQKNYMFQDIQGVDKLTEFYLAAEAIEGLHLVKDRTDAAASNPDGATVPDDNLIVRVNIDRLDKRIMDYRGNSGFFYEYETEDIRDVLALADDRVQTIAYIGSSEMLEPLVQSGRKVADRFVKIGRTMDFDLIWDGYDLVSEMTRKVRC